jgi:hypothetical protein
MKTKTLVIGAIAVGVLLAGGWALAQSAGPTRGFGPPFMHGPGGMGHGRMERMGGHGPGMMHGQPRAAFPDPAQLETLKAELGITAVQETAWSKYARALEDAAGAMRRTRETVDPSTVSGMTPSERFAFVSKIREQGQKQFEAVRTAANELVAVLDDTQKAKAGDILPGLAFGPGPMRRPFAADQTQKY